MKAKSLFIVLVLFLFCLVGAWATSVQALTVGIAEGDVFYYEMYGHFSSSDPDAVIYVPAFENNNTDWVRIEITSVSGSTITHVYTLHYKNGTEDCIDGQTELASNSSYSNGFRGVPICPANLNAGDTIQTLQLTINDTQMRSYPSGERETNHVTWNSTIDYGDCYFDRKTGVLVDLYRVHLYVNPVTNETISKTDVVKMTSSSVWTVPEFPTFLAPSLLIAATTLGAAFYSRKQTKTRMKKEKKVQRSFMRTISAAKTIGSHVSHKGGAYAVSALANSRTVICF